MTATRSASQWSGTRSQNENGTENEEVNSPLNRTIRERPSPMRRGRGTPSSTSSVNSGREGSSSSVSHVNTPSFSTSDDKVSPTMTHQPLAVNGQQLVRSSLDSIPSQSSTVEYVETDFDYEHGEGAGDDDDDDDDSECIDIPEDLGNFGEDGEIKETLLEFDRNS